MTEVNIEQAMADHRVHRPGIKRRGPVRPRVVGRRVLFTGHLRESCSTRGYQNTAVPHDCSSLGVGAQGRGQLRPGVRGWVILQTRAAVASHNIDGVVQYNSSAPGAGFGHLRPSTPLPPCRVEDLDARHGISLHRSSDHVYLVVARDHHGVGHCPWHVWQWYPPSLLKSETRSRGQLFGPDVRSFFPTQNIDAVAQRDTSVLIPGIATRHRLFRVVGQVKETAIPAVSQQLASVRATQTERTSSIYFLRWIHQLYPLLTIFLVVIGAAVGLSRGSISVIMIVLLCSYVFRSKDESNQ